MLCILVLFLLIKPYDTSTNVGTALFFNRRAKTDCWYEDEVAKLRARKSFQQILLPQVTPDKINAKYIRDMLKYYRKALRDVEVISDHHTSVILKEALADTIGGHLKRELLPSVRFAYYAGFIPYRSAREAHEFLENLKTFLNTKGLGWKEPEKVPQWSNLTVVKVLIGSGRLFDPCSCLVMKRDSNSCIHLPVPKLDDRYEPSAVALPFKVGGLVSLASPQSDNILLKYYTTASRCILKSSPKNCRHSDFVNFNNELWHWMKRDVAPHLVDEKLYGAYGGVLRIAAAVQSYGKGLSRRNLFEFESAGVSKWHPWQALTQSYVYFNTDWTPKLYIGMVVLVALAICMLQICYNYMFGDSKVCHCGAGRSKALFTKEVAYANVDSNFPAMLPAPSDRISERNRQRHSSAKTRSSSASVKTQKVYDLNENAEKLMEVIISGNEESETDSPYIGQESEEADNVINLGQSKRPQSPPKLVTPIAQMRIEKPKIGKRGVTMYSASTATHSDVTYCQEQQVSESAWSGTESSSTEDNTGTTDSSKTRSRKTRESRDLAWARRVVKKHSTSSTLHRSTTNTEFDVNSFTTPPSRR